MRLFKTSAVVALLLILSLAVAGASFASKAGELLQKADKAVATARAAKSSADKNDSYERALKTYGEVAGQYPGTPEGAKALLGDAVVRQEAKGKLHDLYLARTSLVRLINEYDQPASALSKTLTDEEMRQVQATVAEAKVMKLSLEKTLDRQNSGGALYKIIDFLVKLTGSKPSFSYWFAIVLLTVIIKVLITPLTKAQFKSMKEMQMIAPKIKEIQAKYKGDQKAIGEKTMELYKEHKINPFASCLPLLIQMPIIMVLWYTMKAYEFKFQDASFLWIGSGLSHAWSVSIPSIGGGGGVVWLTARSLAEPDLILLALYLISMYISTKMSAVDPTQAEQQKMMAIVMPLMFGFIFAGFPSAFLLYWLVLNILQTAQQYMIMHGGPQPAPAPAPAPPADAADTGAAGGGRVRRRRRR